MSFLTPYNHHSLFPWGNPFSNDLRTMRRMLDMTESGARSTHTVEPSYRYEADGEAAHFEIEIPGVSKDNLSVEVHDNKLTVRGKRFRRPLIEKKDDDPAAAKDPAAQNGDPAHPGEDPVPSIVYLLEARLPQGANVDAIKADHVGDGILNMTIPMVADKGTRKIQIEF
ncbi:Heat Shock Protein 20, HSP20 [Chondrus crispus]|uniref:Heat Shock Protein 20, HSP20 n=1 Tax=Chondrus crispus TaxID=2769 RepID=R7QS04_CHOCR|nr:Heat Shock Protein 20, HSP20 [Chondrus crispus]CDF40296.1 Heat Shock Protein 20, HSP20 [Chondrus crispus]|eukprot:XP_005710590.1 Heat Shock Protein 20, HSP20 [Chondrus crispus]